MRPRSSSSRSKKISIGRGKKTVLSSSYKRRKDLLKHLRNTVIGLTSPRSCTPSKRRGKRP
jgi:hypothetical protein